MEYYTIAVVMTEDADSRVEQYLPDLFKFNFL